MTEQSELLTVVFVGRRWLNGKELVNAFAMLEAVERYANEGNGSAFNYGLDGKVTYFSAKRDRASVPWIIGGIYEVSGSASNGRVTNMVTSSRKHLRQIDSPDLRTDWVIADRGAYDESRKVSAMAKLKTDAKASAEIDRLRALYKETSPGNREAWLSGLCSLIRSRG